MKVPFKDYDNNVVGKIMTTLFANPEGGTKAIIKTDSHHQIPEEAVTTGATDNNK